MKNICVKIKDMKREGGFIKIILLIILALVVLGFFGYNLRDITNSPNVHDNLVFVWDLLVKIWHNFIVTPVLWLWDKLVATRG